MGKMRECMVAGVATGKLRGKSEGLTQVLITVANPNHNTSPNPNLTDPI